jgi:hypothetical protein
MQCELLQLGHRTAQRPECQFYLWLDLSIGKVDAGDGREAMQDVQPRTARFQVDSVGGQNNAVSAVLQRQELAVSRRYDGRYRAQQRDVQLERLAVDGVLAASVVAANSA